MANLVYILKKEPQKAQKWTNSSILYVTILIFFIKLEEKYKFYI